MTSTPNGGRARRARASVIRRGLGASLCALLAGTSFGHCLDAYVHAPVTGADPPPAASTKTVTVHVFERAAHMSGAGLALGSAPRSDGAEELTDRIRQAIRGRDLDAFRAALPKDAKLRADWLDRQFILDEAVRSDAGAILAQLLAWKPRVLVDDRGRDSRLRELIDAWAERDRDAESREPDDPPTASGDDEAPATLRMLLDAGADVSDGRALYIVAGLRPSPQVTEAVRLLLAKGVPIEAAAPGRSSPFAAAASRSDVEVVCLMLASAKPSQAALDDALGRTPLVDLNPIAWYLVANGADVNTPYAGVTLANRVRQGDRGLMRLFIEHGMDPDRSDVISELAGDEEFVPALLALSKRPPDPGPYGRSPLVEALRAGARRARSYYFDEPDELVPQGDLATRRSIVFALLDHGADPNLSGEDGHTPLMETARFDDEIVAALIAHGATPEIPIGFRHRGGYEPPGGNIAWALIKGREALALALLRRDPKSLPEDGRELFMLAAESNSTRALAELVERGVNPYGLRYFATDWTPLDAAAFWGALDSIRFMLDHRIGNVNEHTVYPGGITPLMEAVKGRSLEAVRLLVERGARVNDKNAQGHTALDIASDGHDGNARPEIAEFLRAQGER
jgi:ankyrin repeat protein